MVKNWLRSRSTLDFLGLWEHINNPNFKGVEFDSFKSQAGTNSFTLSPSKWIEATGAIGIRSAAGRTGGTYAHQDIAFEFASWVSAEFKLYLIKEFQRLKDDEIQAKSLEWNLTRSLSKLNAHACTLSARAAPDGRATRLRPGHHRLARGSRVRAFFDTSALAKLFVPKITEPKESHHANTTLQTGAC